MDNLLVPAYCLFLTVADIGLVIDSSYGCVRFWIFMMWEWMLWCKYSGRMQNIIHKRSKELCCVTYYYALLFWNDRMTPIVCPNILHANPGISTTMAGSILNQLLRGGWLATTRSISNYRILPLVCSSACATVFKRQRTDEWNSAKVTVSWVTICWFMFQIRSTHLKCDRSFPLL